jgi:hypothetical protein
MLIIRRLLRRTLPRSEQECPGSENPMMRGTKQVSTETKQIVDGIMNG